MKLKAKDITLGALVIFILVGLVILFVFEKPKEKMESFKILVDCLIPVLIPILTGISLKGVGSALLDKYKSKKDD